MNEKCCADMHVHSTASERSKLGVQRSLRLPECATSPEEVYELAKRRGMDFVTLTDHDTIAGALALSHLPDTFISEELTAWFRGEPQAAHVLCYGIDPDDHGWLQAHSGDIEACASYLHAHEITAALAHPFYNVAAPLTASHRRRLAELFPIWESRNGARATELNLPAFVYIETRGGTAIGGSDDHAGIDIGRTYTATPPAATPEEFLTYVRAGRAMAQGDQGSAAKWTHAAIALAIRSLPPTDSASRPSPLTVLRIVERVLREGDARRGEVAGDLGPKDARALLRAWIDAMEFEEDATCLLQLLQGEGVTHADLDRRGRRLHERKLASAVERAVTTFNGRQIPDPHAAATELFEACLPAIPYAAASAFLGREKGKLARSDSERPRVALVVDGVGVMHGVTRTIQEIRERGVPGFEVEVIGTDPGVDRRLSAVTEVEVPFYPGLKLGVPSLSAAVDALADGQYDLIHLVTPGPTGVAASLLALVLEVPRVGSYHTEFAAYAQVRSGRAGVEAIARAALGQFYGPCKVVLSPSAATDARLQEMGISERRIGRWDRGVDHRCFSPAHRAAALLPGDITVLYAGRLTKEKGVDLLADGFLAARRRDPRLHLVLAGGGPEEHHLRARLEGAGTFLGWLAGDELARAYASADMFLFASQTDTFGQVISEAQASGLPVVAVADGGPAGLIEHGKTGLLASAQADRLAEAVLRLAHDRQLRERIGTAAVAAARSRTWTRSLEQLAAGYLRALEPPAAKVSRRRPDASSRAAA